MNALQTDLYQLTMAAGYFLSGKSHETGVFELFIRRLPEHRDYLIAAGLQQAVEYFAQPAIHRRANRLPAVAFEFPKCPRRAFGTIFGPSVLREISSPCAKERHFLRVSVRDRARADDRSAGSGNLPCPRSDISR